MRVLVCGGRNFDDRSAMARVLRRFKPAIPTDDDLAEHVIITGGASGADELAAQYAEVFGIRLRVYPADWKTHGRAAGPIRNQKMLDEGKPDLVIAFPGGRGTADMVRRAKAAGIPVELAKELTNAD